MYTLPFLIDLIVMAIIYLHFKRKRKVLGFSLSMNITMSMTFFFSIFLSFYLMEKFPFYYVLNVFISVSASLIIGGLFGRLKDEQSLIFGIANGSIMGFMSPMVVGVVLYDKWIYTFLQLLFLCVLISLILENKRRRIV